MKNNKNLQNGFILGAALQGKTEATNPFPVTVTFMNGTEEWAKIGVDGEGKIAEPTEPIVSGKLFNKWIDDGTPIIFPYAPLGDKIINADFINLPSGTLRFYKFEENYNDIVNDKTAIPYNSPRFVTDGALKCVYCEQKPQELAYDSSYIMLPTDSFSGITSFTVFGWFKYLFSSYSGDRSLIALGKEGSNNVFQVAIANSKFRLVAGNNVQSSNVNANNDWNFVCITNDGTNAKMYINGVLAHSISGSYNIGEQNNCEIALGTWLGSYKGGRGQSGNCYVSNFGMSNQCITAEEISSYFNATKSKYGVG